MVDQASWEAIATQGAPVSELCRAWQPRLAGHGLAVKVPHDNASLGKMAALVVAVMEPAIELVYDSEPMS